MPASIIAGGMIEVVEERMIPRYSAPISHRLLLNPPQKHLTQDHSNKVPFAKGPCLIKYPPGRRQYKEGDIASC